MFRTCRGSTLRVAPQAAFWTIQGEGYLAGEPSIFLRLSGCTVGCPQCDTDYRFSRTMAVSEIVESCERLREENRRGKYVWITGGEPTDQDLTPLREKLWDSGFFPCLATSGCRELSYSVHDWFWVSVSPHTPDFPLRKGSELKLVPGLNGLDIWSVPMPGLSFLYRYVQPMHGDKESLDDCLEWLRQRDDFRMSPQSHKAWGIP